jgi:hypothetical protein
LESTWRKTLKSISRSKERRRLSSKFDCAFIPVVGLSFEQHNSFLFLYLSI